MIKYGVFTRGGAWRNPKPTGGLYICEQCRLDAYGGNDRALVMQGCHNNRVDPCGRVRRLRGVVVGGTAAQLTATPRGLTLAKESSCKRQCGLRLTSPAPALRAVQVR